MSKSTIKFVKYFKGLALGINCIIYRSNNTALDTAISLY